MEYEEIMQRYDRLLKEPVRLIRRDRMEKVLKKYHEGRPNSERLYDRARKIIPGGVEHRLAFNYPFPLVSKKVDGCYLWDVDDNRYVDLLMCGGPVILGHNYPPFIEKIMEVLKTKGPCCGITDEYELEAGELIRKHMPSCEQVRFFQSGTEADMAAIRVARVYKSYLANKGKWLADKKSLLANVINYLRMYMDRRYIIKVGAGYHGWSSELVYDMHIPGTGAFESHGIPFNVLQKTRSVYPNDLEGLEKKMKKYGSRGGVAAVIVEPNGGGGGTWPVKPGFNQGVRELCDRYGALLIFDEVLTGFRLTLGGGQNYYRVKPDLTILGKIIGHGFPSAGAVGGRKDIMNHFSASDDRETAEHGKKRVFVGGTLAANPLTTAACYWSLKLIEETNAVDQAARAGDRLTKGLMDIFRKYDLPYFAYNFGSILHIETSGLLHLNPRDKKFFEKLEVRMRCMREFSAALITEGILVMAGSRGYTSMAHTDDVVDTTLEAFDRICSWVE